MYWIYCLVYRTPQGELKAFRNETQAWTLRGLSTDFTEAWLFEEAIDGREPCQLEYYIVPGHYDYQPDMEKVPAEVRALIHCPQLNPSTGEV